MSTHPPPHLFPRTPPCGVLDAFLTSRRLYLPNKRLSVLHLVSRLVLVYCIPALYIGETGRKLKQRFGEHLRSIKKNLPGFPVAEHFNTNGQYLRLKSTASCSICDGNRQQKRQEMYLLFLNWALVSRTDSTPTSVFFEFVAGPSSNFI